MWLGEEGKGRRHRRSGDLLSAGKPGFRIFLHTFSAKLSLHSLSVSLSTHSVWSWLIISTGISCVAHQGWKYFNLRGKTNSRGWQISMSRWQLLPVISFNYHIISFYRRGAGCRAANEGARSHAELRAFLNCCQHLACAWWGGSRAHEPVWRVPICRSFHLATRTDLCLMSSRLIMVTVWLATVGARNWSQTQWKVFDLEVKKILTWIPETKKLKLFQK